MTRQSTLLGNCAVSGPGHPCATLLRNCAASGPGHPWHAAETAALAHAVALVGREGPKAHVRHHGQAVVRDNEARRELTNDVVRRLAELLHVLHELEDAREVVGLRLVDHAELLEGLVHLAVALVLLAREPRGVLCQPLGEALAHGAHRHVHDVAIQQLAHHVVDDRVEVLLLAHALKLAHHARDDLVAHRLGRGRALARDAARAHARSRARTCARARKRPAHGLHVIRLDAQLVQDLERLGHALGALRTALERKRAEDVVAEVIARTCTSARARAGTNICCSFS